MNEILDLDRYPLDRPEATLELVRQCREELAREGMFNLVGFVRPQALSAIVEHVQPLASHDSFTHQRRHNVYFFRSVAGLAEDHPALTRFETINHTVCGDQLRDNLITRIYEWAPLQQFIASVLNIEHLYAMEDPLARLNIMEYRPGEALNWHFDRSRYTTTLLLQSAELGGEFEYRTGLRSDDDQNYEAVGRFLAGEDSACHINTLEAGTLNIFAGKNTLHRVSTVRGNRSRLVAVFSYYDRPNVLFSEEERLGFYGRSTARLA
jgi:hypothetical protein